MQEALHLCTYLHTSNMYVPKYSYKVSNIQNMYVDTYAIYIRFRFYFSIIACTNIDMAETD